MEETTEQRPCQGCEKKFIPGELEDCFVDGESRSLCLDCRNDLHICEECGENSFELSKVYSQSDSSWRLEEVLVCESCYDKGDDCSSCGKRMLEGHSRLYGENDVRLCVSCYDDYFICNDCSYCVPVDDMIATHGEDTICHDCYDDHYFTCGGCNHVHHNDYYGGDGYCERCYERETEPEPKDYGIKNYSYKPSPRFHYVNPDSLKEKGVEMGFELEVGKGPDLEGAHIVKDSPLSSFLYMKEDCSIPDYGFEIVSHPASYDYHKSIRPQLVELFKNLVGYGYRSHDAGGCGLHIHINKKALTDDKWRRLDYFINAQQEMFTALARRNSSYGEIKKKSIHECGMRGNRRESVNFNNVNTVELRFPKGTLNIATFNATIELAKYLLDYVREANASEIVQDRRARELFLSKLWGTKEYTNLREYANHRGLMDDIKEKTFETAS